MRERVLLVSPLLVLASQWALFVLSSRQFGPRLGYFLGFVCYWLVWCAGLSWWVTGSRLIQLFRPGNHPLGLPVWLGALLLALPLAGGYLYAFPRALRGASLRVILASFGLAGMNAIAEEVLWRGAFVSAFPHSVSLAVVYPALGFGAWHFAPQTVHRSPYPGGAWSFVAVSTVLGLMWGWVAFSSRSLLATAVSHVLFDFSGLGARLYLASSPPASR